MSESPRVMIRVSPYLKKKIRDIAEQMYLTGRADSDTESEFVRSAVREKIDREERRQPQKQ